LKTCLQGLTAFYVNYSNSWDCRLYVVITAPQTLLYT